VSRGEPEALPSDSNGVRRPSVGTSVRRRSGRGAVHAHGARPSAVHRRLSSATGERTFSWRQEPLAGGYRVLPRRLLGGSICFARAPRPSTVLRAAPSEAEGRGRAVLTDRKLDVWNLGFFGKAAGLGSRAESTSMPAEGQRTALDDARARAEASGCLGHLCVSARPPASRGRTRDALCGPLLFSAGIEDVLCARSVLCTLC
jgi:hypothetical protein